MKPTTAILIAAPVLMLVVALANVSAKAMAQVKYDIENYEVMK